MSATANMPSPRTAGLGASGIHVRLATEADAPALAAFNQALALETEGKHLPGEVILPGVRNLFARPEYGFYLAAETGGALVGTLMVTYEWSDWRNGVFFWVQSVYVLPEHRGKGAYRALYAAVKRIAAERGDCCGFRLYVEKENTRAQAVYERLGMRQTHYLMYGE